MSRFPFIFGSQYYRAPTPEPECWAGDMQRMRELGFNTIKLFVQWRWSHRGEERFYWDDLDALMDLAHEHGLAVTLNTLLDMSPVWLFGKHPDAKQINASGQTIEPYEVGHRTIGGHPGPCYRHPGALAERRRFLAAAVEHFRGHPALWSWDVWNEPEQAFQQRVPDFRTLVCYCPHCRGAFAEWLERKYGCLDRLNAVWGRCYESWAEVEPARTGGAITDFVDWREFHLDTMTAEAAWRLQVVRERDSAHPCYLHVVPNTMATFSSVTCVDDFALAEPCDLFAASLNGQPEWCAQVLSAARGKVCYNVESHVNFGSAAMHQRRLELPDLLPDFLAQVGWGVKGFLFWQYRPEVLGTESPAWGLVKPDGTDRPVTHAVQAFWSTLQPHAEALLQAGPPPPAIGLWKSRRNEVFHFAIHGSLQPLAASVQAYINALYWHSYPFRIVSEAMLGAGELEGLRLLIMPSCYYLTEEEAGRLDEWVRQGGVLLCEAHLGGYNGTTGRHSRTVPGCGLAAAWGLHEADSTSAHHLRLRELPAFAAAAPAEVAEALHSLQSSGAPFFPIHLADGTFAWGADRYALLAGEGLTVEGSFDGVHPCLASQAVGAGHVLYCGTNLGQGAARGDGGLLALIRRCAARAGVAPTLQLAAGLPGTLHVDVLGDGAGPHFLVAVSRADQVQAAMLAGEGAWRGLFTGARWELGGETECEVPAGLAELFVRAGR